MSKRAFVVRGAVDPDTVRWFGRRAADGYRRWDAKIAQATDAELAPFNQGHIPVTDADTSQSKFASLANNGYLRELMRGVFRWDRPLLPPYEVMLRRILPPNARSPYANAVVAFHQDEYFGLQSVPGAKTLPLGFTMWLPLVPCGIDAPGLSVVPGSDLPIVMGEPAEGWQAYVERVYGGFWSPELEVGDVLLFTSRVIHGSYVTSTMTKPRYSLEMRGRIN